MWNSNDHKADIFYLKGFAEAVLQKAGIRPEAFQPLRSGHLEDAWEWRQGGKRLVHSGQISGKLSAAFDIDMPVFYAEVDWDYLMQLRKEHRVTYKEVSRYQAVRRDLSLFVIDGTSFDWFKKLSSHAENRLLKKIKF